MIILTFILFLALSANLCLGVIVYFTNRHRRVNQAFLLSAFLMVLWLCANILILNSSEESQAIFHINLASAISSCLPTSFQLLRLAIKFPNASRRQISNRCKYQLLLNFIAVALCFLPAFTESVEFPNPENSINIAKPNYGPAFIFFLIYMLGSIFALSINVIKDRKTLQGSKRLELDFLIFACLSGLVVGIFLGTIVGLITQSANSVPVANAGSVLTVSGIVAYGISVHRILTVSALLQRISAYALVVVFLGIVYYLTFYVASTLFELLGIGLAGPSHFISTLTVAFCMLPARQRFLRATEKIFTPFNIFNVQSVLKEAGEIFQSVTTSAALLQHFYALLSEAYKTDKLHILIKQNNQYVETDISPELKFQLPADNPITSLLKKIHEPISSDHLTRIRQTSEICSAIKSLNCYEVSVAAGIYSKSQIIGLILLAPKNKNQIYDKIEQDTLQILCNQFAVALENARLYTAMQDSKIQNEIMLDQLASGVVVASPNRKITLFNNEAQKITGIGEKNAIGENIAVLPREIHLALEVTLENENGVRNIDATLYPDEDSEDFPKYIRISSAFLFGHDGKPMGALLVFTDITELKALEEQVRRSDQLSSVGTLAAGMAHEIKNPLVTIKTFTQLLPRRYNDEDFRKDFSSLVAHEVERIDGIVNELLSFSKPAKPHLVPMDVQETVDQTLKLIHEQLSQNNIKLKNNCKADKSDIFGDAKLLSQAFINLALNAIDAIGENGTLTVGTLNCAYRFANGDTPDRAVTRKCIRIQITDNGKGIARENLQKIFDPFFTSKSEGTGMGLSVAHGIISEHHGVIEVDSEPGRGTTFYLYMPLLEEKVAG
ncbi:ATP-binding protein [Pontiella agarivorans]|uniref:histidine kinase n=1 Tax=Pontiella agarivorans TaxID=3038953 RepID=A0ABU5MV10_9BACT|nr:ATP-binding protein [Pontiella agarivorans]MDZ8118047.1 ATP-binding protein [Pontiella agarivorans]